MLSLPSAVLSVVPAIGSFHVPVTNWASTASCCSGSRPYWPTAGRTMYSVGAMAAGSAAADGAAAIFFGSSAMAAAVESATAKKQTAVRENPGFMWPIVDAGLRQRQALGP